MKEINPCKNKKWTRSSLTVYTRLKREVLSSINNMLLLSSVATKPIIIT